MNKQFKEPSGAFEQGTLKDLKEKRDIAGLEKRKKIIDENDYVVNFMHPPVAVLINACARAWNEAKLLLLTRKIKTVAERLKAIQEQDEEKARELNETYNNLLRDYLESDQKNAAAKTALDDFDINELGMKKEPVTKEAE